MTAYLISPALLGLVAIVVTETPVMSAEIFLTLRES